MKNSVHFFDETFPVIFFAIFATLEAISKMMSNRVFFQDAYLNEFQLFDILEN